MGDNYYSGALRLDCNWKSKCLSEKPVQKDKRRERQSRPSATINTVQPWQEFTSTYTNATVAQASVWAEWPQGHSDHLWVNRGFVLTCTLSCLRPCNGSRVFIMVQWKWKDLFFCRSCVLDKHRKIEWTTLMVVGAVDTNICSCVHTNLSRWLSRWAIGN